MDFYSTNGCAIGCPRERTNHGRMVAPVWCPAIERLAGSWVHSLLKNSYVANDSLGDLCKQFASLRQKIQPFAITCQCHGPKVGFQLKRNTKDLRTRDLSSRGQHFISIKTSTQGRKCILKQTTKVTCAHKGPHERQHVVKMCGITSARDAALAAEAGADYIGMIIWPKSKRSVSLTVAKQISKVAREYGARPVGVFVDDDADTILKASDAADIELVQLHGNGSRVAFPILVKEKKVIYVLHVSEDGELLNTIHDEESSLVDWVLVDSARGGSGKGFNWTVFKLPPIRSKCGWLLAGGVYPGNVCEAISTLNPHGVDVSSGICARGGIQKDKLQITAFMNAVNSLTP